MAKFDLKGLLNDRSVPDRQQDQKIVYRNPKDLIPSEENFYNTEKLERLKQSIKLLGILQPLLIENRDGKDYVIAGHCRRKCCIDLLNEGNDRFSRVPCIYKTQSKLEQDAGQENDIVRQIMIIQANCYRDKSDWEKMTETLKMEGLVKELREKSPMEGKTRDILKDLIGTSGGQLGRYHSISTNLCEQLMSEFKEDRIKISVAYEVSKLNKEYQNQATGRCSVKGSKFWFNCNPDGPYHWFKQNWIDKSTGYLGKEETARRMQQAAAEGKDPGLKDILYLHFTMDDNLSLDEEIKARYRSMYVGVFFKRYIMGLWAAAEGIIYDMFDENKHVQDIKDFYQLLINGNRYVSCDYGTQNATVFLLWNKGTNGKWYCIREYYYSGRDKGKQKTDSEYADDLKVWLDGTKIKAIIVDPSAASFIAELRKRGYKVLKANNDVLDGIRLVGMLLNLEKIVFASSCKETIKEFASYIWDEKALERGEDKPVKQFDHCCDAVRYLCSTIIGRKAARFREIRR